MLRFNKLSANIARWMLAAVSVFRRVTTKTTASILISILLGVSLFAQGGGQTINIPIQNPSFETPVNLPDVVSDPNGCGTNGQGDIPGWVSQPLQGGSSSGVAHWTCQPLPDGSQVAFAGYGMRLVQDLRTPAQAGTYILKFSVSNWFNGYTGPWAAKIWIGGWDIPNQGTRYSHELCSTSGYGLYEFTEKTLVCDIPSYIAPHSNGFRWDNFVNDGIDGDLVISLDGTGWTVMFDNISLTFTPTN